MPAGPPYDPDDLPIGFDRADGSGGRPGTPTPFANLTFNGRAYNGESAIAAAVGLQELPDSPEIERAEQCTGNHKFRMPWVEGINRLTFIGRGSIFTDSGGLVWRVLSAKLKRERGGMCSLETTSESVSFDSPPDEFQITPVELGINIIKHPRYLYALIKQDGDSATDVTEKQTIVRLIQQYIDAPVAPEKSAVVSQLGMTLDDSPVLLYAKAAAQEIVQKLWLQEDNPYVIAYRIVWSVYYFRPIFLDPGGRKEDPIQDGGLPDYFGSPSGDYNVDTIFDLLAVYNPQCYKSPSGSLILSSLRLADEYEYQRTWFKVTRQWIVSPIGNWDPQIYNPFERPADWTTNNPVPYLLIEGINDQP